MRICRWRAALASERGAISVLTSMLLVALVGVAALGTEVGTWYWLARKQQNAADAAARAGAIALAAGQDQLAITAAATDLATRNGFSVEDGADIIVHSPPESGALTGNGAAVEVIIRQPRPIILTRLFLDTAPAISARAVAQVSGAAKACALGLDGGLTMSGNSLSSGPDCIMASNATGAGAISVSGSAQVVAYSLSAVGGCTGCSSANVQLNKPYAEYQLPVSNPYQVLDTKSFPTSCLGSPPSQGTILPTGLTHAYCQSISVPGQKTLDFSPGTYVFRNASFSASGGSRITCSTCGSGMGLTMIFTGDPNSVGTVSISGQAEVELRAPTTNADDPDFDGVLFYRDAKAVSGTAVSISGGSDSVISGAMYFPTSSVQFSGNSGVQFSSCTALVAGSVDLTGSSATYVDVSGCDESSVRLPRVQIIRMAE